MRGSRHVSVGPVSLRFKIGGVFETPTPTHLWDGGSGFAGGVTCEWQSSSSGIAVGASLNYERRTMNYAGDALTLIGYEPPQDAGGDFLALPIDVKYKFMLPALKELAGPYVLTGPDIALRLSKGGGRQAHVGWNFGVGFDIINHFQVSGGYRLGLNKLDYDGLRDSGGWVSVAVLFDI